MTTETMTVTTTAPAPAAPAAAPAANAAPAAAPAAPAAVATSIDDPVVPSTATNNATKETTPAPADAAPAVVQFDPTGDPGLDLALDFLGKLGLDTADPAMAAAEGGDFSLLKAKLATMGEAAKGWEQMLALAERAVGDRKAAAEAKSKATQDAILSAFGEDKEAAAKEWAQVRDWAKANAEPHEREAVNAALAAGGIAAKAMAAYLGNLYRAHPSATVEPAAVTKVGGRSASNDGALSPEAYKTAVTALRAQLGGRMDGSPEYKALQARRMAFRG